MSSDGGPGPVVGQRLGYLLKHAEARLEQLGIAALAPLGIDPREFGILLVVASHEPGSQQQAADRLGIDRTTMVARLDALEAKGLVVRRPHAEDRRRNVVALTDAGQATVEKAVAASDDAEAALLTALTPRQRDQLRRLLGAVVLPDA